MLPRRVGTTCATGAASSATGGTAGGAELGSGGGAVVGTGGGGLLGSGGGPLMGLDGEYAGGASVTVICCTPAVKSPIFTGFGGF